LSEEDSTVEVLEKRVENLRKSSQTTMGYITIAVLLVWIRLVWGPMFGSGITWIDILIVILLFIVACNISYPYKTPSA
jgi:multisubunit Na+/H+ antiporter MnhF subunit